MREVELRLGLLDVTLGEEEIRRLWDESELGVVEDCTARGLIP